MNSLLLSVGVLILGLAGNPSGMPLSKTLSPIVFIPGKAGNQMEAKVDKTWSFYNSCPLQKDWHRLWMDVWELFPDKINCWSENMQLQFNASSNTSRNAPGVDIRIPGWGDTETIEYLDPSWAAWFFGNVGRYMEPFIRELAVWGYVKGVNFRAAPYDFRLAPNSQSAYFRDLTLLIEDTYELNGQQAVILMSHSMGGLMGRHFLFEKTTQWKDTYIRAFVPVNAPWKGTVKLVHSLTSGYNWEVDSIDPLVIRMMQRTHETALLLLPLEGAWAEDDVIVSTPRRNYTVMDYVELFGDAHWAQGQHLLDYVREPDAFEHPGVRTFCFYGGGVPTAEQLIYDDDDTFPDAQPEVVWGDGDGTVNAASLSYCNHWVDDPQHGEITHAKHLDNTDHLATFLDSTFLNWLHSFVLNTA